MGQLNNLYSAVAGCTPSFTYNSHSVTVYDPSTLPAAINPANLPVRVLIPLGQEADAKQGQFIALGHGLGLSWTVPDLMLLAATGGAQGVTDYAVPLLQYCDAYSDLLQTMRSFPGAPQCILESFSITPGIYSYPLGSGQLFAGVIALLNYKEVLS